MPVKVLNILRKKYLSQWLSKCLHENIYKHYFLFNFLPHQSRNFTSGADYENFESEMEKYYSFISEKSYINQLQNPESKIVKHIIHLLEDKKNIEAEVMCLNEMSSDGDKDLEKLKQEEKEKFLTTLGMIKSEVYNNILLLNDEDDNRSLEIKVTPLVGGAEAELFSKELFNMYLNYISLKNWTYDSFDKEQGKIVVSGEFAYKHLKQEAGVHRVQRVPETEKSGRVHTSSCSVLVLPQPKSFEVKLNEKELVIDKMRSSGPGGQNVNKTESCIRVTHKPTGISVESQISRHQYENKTIALEKLKMILFTMEREKFEASNKDLKIRQVGKNDDSEKIRTYNFPQNRVTDHRINYTMSNLKGFLTGGNELDVLINNLIEHNRKNDILYYIKKVIQSANYKTGDKINISN